ncbi:type III effector 1 [Pseudomonas sp. RGM2987]|uniref:type III effector 1 n=1 Tax=Pseudomonas sp. RGM2987 TaxID=2930090 RepID=UPI001FD678BB|nr:type III effector 1 [Pseudomonas sp. RGM2987]MCJ8205945.1 type III effector 1 [Pseudomonas sp. RGM2987]
MDNTAERQSNMNDGQPAPLAQASTPQSALERLARWQAHIDPRLQAQMTVLQMLEEYLLVELRTRYLQGNIDPHFIDTLIETVLRRLIDPQWVFADEEQDAPYRWPEGPDRGFSTERQEIIVQVLEGAAAGFIRHYKDYLRRYWALTEPDPDLEGVISQRLGDHQARLDRLLLPQQLAGLEVEELRERIEAFQDAWRRMGSLAALASPQERQDLEAMTRKQLPQWLRYLDDEQLRLLKAYQGETAQAQALLDGLLDGLGSLQAFARHQGKAYVRHELDMEVEPDAIRVQLQWRGVLDQPLQTHSLSELLAAGPLRPDAVSVFLVENGAMLRNQPLSADFISRLLAQVDAPAGYLSALVERYARADLKDAMLDWFAARLRQSAFVARCAGHLQVSNHDALKTLWDPQASPILQVAGLILPNNLQCAELLLFSRQDLQGDLLLYAPDKPDGQEWIELPSLRAVSAQLGAWVEEEAGREYLLQQLFPADRLLAREYFSGVAQKPTSWDLGQDPRNAATDLQACLENAVAMGLANNLAQVEREQSPRWYVALPLESRQIISSLNQEIRVHQRVFDEQMTGYEVFMDFAKRTVAQAIAPYMLGKGVTEPVDPATVLIDYKPGLAGGPSRVANLLELAIHGYDDNWGIEHPEKGVRSSVGQDLGNVRSADLATYIRRAFLGEQYARQIRAQFLDAQAPVYMKRRLALHNLLLARMDRDLRVARARSQVDDPAFWWLTRQVTLLGDALPDDSLSARGSGYPEKVVQREGLIRFTVGGHVVAGVYVFSYFEPRAFYWLYTPDAPDGVLLRQYQDFSAAIAARLHDYVLGRVALSARAAVKRSLAALAAATRRVDTLREFNRVNDIRTEFDASIERAIVDVQDITQSRVEVVQNQVIKGLLFVAAPVCMVYPPFALLLDVAFIAVTSRQATEAHVQGDTDRALGHWLMASWGALFAVFGAAGIAGLLGGAVRRLKLAVRPLSLSAQRLRQGTSVLAKEAGPVIQPLRFNPKQAVRKPPEHLQLVTEEGIFHGTYLSPASATRPRGAYYLRSNGRYYQVSKDPHFGGLCLVDARRPDALYKLPIRRMANGKWTHNVVGLPGGNEQMLNLGRVSNLREAFPGHVFPDVARGALQGEAVVARFSEAVADNYLFSLNAQTCVIASLYNPSTRVGAVIHFDHNIRPLIERSVRDVTQRLGGGANDIRVTLAGGDWLTGTDIGGRVRSVMRRQGLEPAWDHWSYSSCFGNSYGVVLDLRSGVTSVFKTSRGQVERYYIPVLARAKNSTDPVSVRARGFMTRVRGEPLVADAHGVVHTSHGGPATAAQIESQALPTVVLS